MSEKRFMAINQRVTVDFDSESYYLDGKYWESWDSFGEEMADAINREFNKLADENTGLMQTLKRTYGELKYFVGLHKKDDVDISVHNLLDSLEVITQNTENDGVISCFNYFFDKSKRLEHENEQLKRQIKQIQSICRDNKIPTLLTTYIPMKCKMRKGCLENHMVNADTMGKSNLANEILNVLNDGDGV